MQVLKRIIKSEFFPERYFPRINAWASTKHQPKRTFSAASFIRSVKAFESKRPLSPAVTIQHKNDFFRSLLVLLRRALETPILEMGLKLSFPEKHPIDSSLTALHFSLGQPQMGASRLRRSSLQQRGMPGCSHP
jgi:hypothetical protein